MEDFEIGDLEEKMFHKYYTYLLDSDCYALIVKKLKKENEPL